LTFSDIHKSKSRLSSRCTSVN